MTKHRDQRGLRGAPELLTGAFLRAWPLPAPDEQGDKNTRGSVLIVGGSAETPGAVILAATAALRSGVGRLRLAVPQRLALSIGMVVPEARVFALPETRDGEIAASAADQLSELANHAQAVLLGPGMLDAEGAYALLERLIPNVDRPVLVLDAGALNANTRNLRVPLPHNVIMTPHAGEMAQLLGREKDAVAADPAGIACDASSQFGGVMVLKGSTTWIASEDTLLKYEEGRVGLATSGSGDTLSGMVAGLAARASDPAQAAAWGVYLHGETGNRLAGRVGRVGFLAREIPDQVPFILRDLE